MNEDGYKTMNVAIDGMHCERCVKSIETAFAGLEGIDGTDVEVGKATIRYLPQLISTDEIGIKIVESGYSIRERSIRKGFLNRFLDRMIASNEKNFGTGRLDCCDLQSKDKTDG